ncbi:hypothetical protein WMY93_010629 [Mugilogobius chulae]|uniref:Uncharacterized protein n=1 Tax=Mugilogobius chulae TaxID=88201 RepID=A0AAW0P930_9GOBI
MARSVTVTANICLINATDSLSSHNDDAQNVTRLRFGRDRIRADLRWIEHKYADYRDNYLSLISAMANNSMSSIVSLNSTEDVDLEDAVAFPNELYNVASKASDQSSASWHESAVDDFLNVVTQQADGLRTCGHSAEVWE